ncbi:pentapeptide repeat-containing protein [Streptomyces durmitorensis]
MSRGPGCNESTCPERGWSEQLGTDLRQASMRSVLLCHARLDDADLRAADLSNADLTAAVIGAARFELADLRGAVLTGTDLTGAPPRGRRCLPTGSPFRNRSPARE